MAVLLREARVPERAPAAADRDRAAHVLVQRARSAPARRARASAPACRSTSTSCSATRSSRSARACIIPWTTQGKGLFQYYERLLEGLAARPELLARHPVARPARRRAGGGAARRELQGHRQVEEPLRPRDALLLRLRGRRALHRAPVPAGRVRHAARSAGRSTCARCRARSATATASSPRCSPCMVHGHSIAEASQPEPRRRAAYFSDS